MQRSEVISVKYHPIITMHHTSSVSSCIFLAFIKPHIVGWPLKDGTSCVKQMNACNMQGCGRIRIKNWENESDLGKKPNTNTNLAILGVKYYDNFFQQIFIYEISLKMREMIRKNNSACTGIYVR